MGLIGSAAAFPTEKRARLGRGAPVSAKTHGRNSAKAVVYRTGIRFPDGCRKRKNTGNRSRLSENGPWGYGASDISEK